MRAIRISSAALAFWVVVIHAGFGLACAADAERSAFPLKVGGDGRYLVDQNDRPFFYHADTGWNLAKKLTLEEAVVYLDDRKARGFTAIQIQAVSKEQGPMANRAGHNPFEPADDILKPNEAYWGHLDRVLDAARERGFLVAMAPLWIRWGGNDKEGWRNQLTDENAAAYGRFLGERYRRFDNLVWILGGDANPKEKTDAINTLAAALKAAAPKQLITVHNAPEHASAAFFDASPWLDVNMAYSYREVQPHVLAEYARKPVRPIVLGESGYEAEDNDKRGGDAWRMRRQAYGAMLSGACGHAFGTRHIWRFDGEWKGALDTPATRHMGHLKKLFASRRWERLVPDAKHEIVIDGYGKPGDVDYVSAAGIPDGTLMMAYLPTRRAVAVDPQRVASGAAAYWFDPTDGSLTEAAQDKPKPPWKLEPPAKNAAGDGDFVLVIEVGIGKETR